MALLIDASVSLNGNISIDKAYLRLEYTVNQYGNKIEVPVYTYYDKSSYEEDKTSPQFKSTANLLSSPLIPRYFNYTYDKDIDGTDILQISHDKTRDYFIDASIFGANQISIVDIDSSVA